MMTNMRTRGLIVVIAAASLASCALRGPPASPGAPPEPSPSGTAQPPPQVPGQPPPAAPPPPGAPGPRQFRLSAATSALVAQAHKQSSGGDYGQAAVTLERALRIEPGNPLLWIELGRARLEENNAAQADAMGRKALALATGDSGAQSSAWHLIADSLRARGRDPEAAEAEQRAGSLAPR